MGWWTCGVTRRAGGGEGWRGGRRQWWRDEAMISKGT